MVRGDERSREGCVEWPGDETGLARRRELAELCMTERRARCFEPEGAKARAAEIAVVATYIKTFAHQFGCSQVVAIGNKARS